MNRQQGPTAAEERLLVRAMLAGDQRAFDSFCDEYLPILHRFARSRLPEDPELARDMVQATLCKIFDRLHTFRGESSLATWVCVCCRNEIGMHLRRRRRGPRLVELDDSVDAQALTPHEASPRRHLLIQEESQLVHEALDQLPPKYGRALEWKYIEGLSVLEIATRLELGAKAAESLLTRARGTFREIYGRLKEGIPNATVHPLRAPLGSPLSDKRRPA